MANYFDCTCRFCGKGIFIHSAGPESDEVKMRKMFCVACESKDLQLEPMDDAYYARHPDAFRIREDGPSYPFNPPKESMN